LRDELSCVGSLRLDCVIYDQTFDCSHPISVHQTQQPIVFDYSHTSIEVQTLNLYMIVIVPRKMDLNDLRDNGLTVHMDDMRALNATAHRRPFRGGHASEASASTYLGGHACSGSCFFLTDILQSRRFVHSITQRDDI